MLKAAGICFHFISGFRAENNDKTMHNGQYLHTFFSFIYCFCVEIAGEKDRTVLNCLLPISFMAIVSGQERTRYIPTVKVNFISCHLYAKQLANTQILLQKRAGKSYPQAFRIYVRAPFPKKLCPFLDRNSSSQKSCFRSQFLVSWPHLNLMAGSVN